MCKVTARTSAMTGTCLLDIFVFQKNDETTLIYRKTREKADELFQSVFADIVSVANHSHNKWKEIFVRNFRLSRNFPLSISYNYGLTNFELKTNGQNHVDSR